MHHGKEVAGRLRATARRQPKTMGPAFWLCMLLLAAAVYSGVQPTAASAEPARSLTVVAGDGLPVGEPLFVRITGPGGFRKTIRKPGRFTFRNLAYGTYVAEAKRVTFKRTTGNGAVAGLSATSLVNMSNYEKGSIKPTRNKLTLKPKRFERFGRIFVTYTSAPPPGGPVFSQLAAGGDHTCGLRRARGIVSCWGDKAVIYRPPAGAFTKIVDDGEGICGLRPNGRATCWGMDLSTPKPPADRFKDIGVGQSFACGLKPAGSVKCWWRKDYFPAGGPSVPAGRFVQIRAGGLYSPDSVPTNAFVCGLKTDASVACAGGRLGKPYISPPGSFKQLAGGINPCGLRTDGTPACWFTSPDSTTVSLEGRFAQFSFNGNVQCGVQPDQTVKCSRPPWDVPSPPLPGPFTQVVVGYNHACGLRSSGKAACWWTDVGSPSRNKVGQLEVPKR